MPEKDNLPVQGDLLEALDALTGLIAKHDHREEPHTADGVAPEPDLDRDLEGLEFGSAVDDLVPPLEERIETPLPAVPTPREVEAVVDLVLDHHLAELRAQLKREILLELRKRYR